MGMVGNVQVLPQHSQRSVGRQTPLTENLKSALPFQALGPEGTAPVWDGEQHASRRCQSGGEDLLPEAPVRLNFMNRRQWSMRLQ